MKSEIPLRDTLHEIRLRPNAQACPREGGDLCLKHPHSTKCAAIYCPNPKNLKKFSSFFTSCFTTTYLILCPLSAVCYTLFFEPNAQLRPFIEGYFSCPELACGELVEPVEGRSLKTEYRYREHQRPSFTFCILLCIFDFCFLIFAIEPVAKKS